MSKGILEEAQGYLQDAYRKLEIRETISRYRQRFDSEVINHKYMKQLRELPEKPKEIKASIEKELVCISTQLNDRFPYATTVCRSHPELIVASLVGFVAIPLWSRRKWIGPFLYRDFSLTSPIYRCESKALLWIHSCHWSCWGGWRECCQFQMDSQRTPTTKGHLKLNAVISAKFCSLVNLSEKEFLFHAFMP